jgi:regulator of ribonuclease activity A
MAMQSTAPTAAEIVTADIFDAYHTQVAVCEAQFRSFGKRKSLVGECETLKVFEDHTPVLEALQRPGQGRVLIVDAGGSLRVGVLGDRLAAVGMRNGWSGAIVYGAVRDSGGIDGLEFGVKALGVTARRGSLKTTGFHNVPITFGSAQFEPGNWIYADTDCVLVSKTKLTIPPIQGITE